MQKTLENWNDWNTLKRHVCILETHDQVLMPQFLSAKPSSMDELILSIVMLVNEKYRIKSIGKLWTAFEQEPIKFSKLLSRLLKLFFLKDQETNYLVKQEIILFLTRCFQTLEVSFVRTEVLRLVNISTWTSLASDRTRSLKLDHAPELQTLWDRTESKFQAIGKVSSGSHFQIRKRKYQGTCTV